MSLSDIKNPLSPAKGKKRKFLDDSSVSYLEASPELKKTKLDPHYKKLREFSTNESAPFNMALGEIGARYYKNINPEYELLFKTIANGDNPMKPKIFDEKTCLSIKQDIGIGQRKWDILRARFHPHIILTSRYKLQNYTIKQNPPVEQFLNGVWIPLSYALPITLKETLETKKDFKPSSSTPNLLELDAFIVLMYDGSGSHEQMKGDDIEIWTRNINLGMHLHTKVELIWELVLNWEFTAFPAKMLILKSYFLMVSVIKLLLDNTEPPWI